MKQETSKFNIAGGLVGYRATGAPEMALIREMESHYILNLRCSIPKCSYNKRRWRSVKHNSNNINSDVKKVILGLHVSILLNHLQALVFQIHTKNAIRIVGSPTLTIKTKLQNYKTNNKTECM